jgi:hypothetical protein
MTCALGVLAPVRIAQRLYERARVAERPSSILASAARWDPWFPLYDARAAWALAVEGRDPVRAAGDALRAAERAPGVAALWLAAGLLGADAGETWSADALRRACDLDPLGALAPFRLLLLEADAPGAALSGARALLAEPRLAAAMDWQGRAPLFDRVLEQVALWPGVDPTWRRQTVAALRSLPPPRGLSTRPFFLELDREAQTSLSLFVFRRLPWPAALGPIELDADRLRPIAIGSAAVRPDTESWAFPKNGCRGAEPPA